MLLIAGAALAAPAPFLRLEVAGAGTQHLAVPDDGTFLYRYRHSVYEALVEERYRVEGDRLRQVEIRSADRRALEYYGLPGEPSAREGTLALAGQSAALARIDLRVLPGAAQTLVVGERTVDLSGSLGDASVRLTAVLAPRAAALLPYRR